MIHAIQQTSLLRDNKINKMEIAIRRAIERGGFKQKYAHLSKM